MPQAASANSSVVKTPCVIRCSASVPPPAPPDTDRARTDIATAQERRKGFPFSCSASSSVSIRHLRSSPPQTARERNAENWSASSGWSAPYFVLVTPQVSLFWYSQPMALFAQAGTSVKGCGKPPCAASSAPPRNRQSIAAASTRLMVRSSSKPLSVPRNSPSFCSISACA